MDCNGCWVLCSLQEVTAIPWDVLCSMSLQETWFHDLHEFCCMAWVLGTGMYVCMRGDTQKLANMKKWLTFGSTQMTFYRCLPSSQTRKMQTSWKRLYYIPSRPSITQWVVWWKEPNLSIEMKGRQKRSWNRHGLRPEMSNEVIYFSAGSRCLICEILQIPSVHSGTFNSQMCLFRNKWTWHVLFFAPNEWVNQSNHSYCHKCMVMYLTMFTWRQEIV